MARFIGPYEVIQDLDPDHPGTVFLASGEVPSRGAERPTRRTVVIKRLRELGDRSRALAALRERLARLDPVADRRIARVHAVLDDENAVVLEHIQGVNIAAALDALHRSKEQFYTEAAVEIACEVAEALHAAYAGKAANGETLGLLHQRIAPANILLCPSGEVRLLDFGVAQLLPSDAARGYASPEQARGEEIDHRSDLFSLGLVLFEMLTGYPAYGDAGLEPPVNPRDLREPCQQLAQILPGVGPVLCKLLRARPDERHQRGGDLVADLRRQLSQSRGAYLQEFCSFYFSILQPLPQAPARYDMNSLPTPSVVASPKSNTLEMIPLSVGKDRGPAAADKTTFVPLGPARAAPPVPKPVAAELFPIVRPPAELPRPPMVVPIAAYGNVAGAPFQVAQRSVTPPTDGDERIQSHRVYAILVAVWAMVGVAILLATYVIINDRPPPPPPVTVSKPVIRVIEGADGGESSAEDDDGIPPPVPPLPHHLATTSPSRPPTSPSGPAPLTVRLADLAQASSFEVDCPGSFRQRSPLIRGTGTVAGVPNENCQLNFHGGTPLSYGPVHGGESLTCTVAGTTAVCR